MVMPAPSSGICAVVAGFIGDVITKLALEFLYWRRHGIAAAHFAHRRA